MPRHNIKDKTINELSVEIALLSDEIDARIAAQRIVLAWILKDMPDDAGRKFISGQANIFDTEDKDIHRTLMVNELDELKAAVSFFRGVGASD